jgi:hypothetical protein
MTRDEIQKLAALRRVHAFLTAHAPATPPAAFTAELTALGHSIDRLGALAVDQDAGRRRAEGETRTIAATRETLVDTHMRPVSLLARELFTEEPGVGRALRLPRDSRLPVPRLTAAAGAMAEIVEPHASRFVEAGFPQSFVADLRSAASAVQQAVADRTVGQRRRSEATAAVRSEIARARRSVALLHPMALRLLADRPELLEGWKAARRVGATGGGAHGGAATSATPRGVDEPPVALVAPADDGEARAA